MDHTPIRYGQLLFLVIILVFCSMGASESRENSESGTHPTIRPPAVAGSFYPSSPDQLRRIIKQLLDEASPVSPEGDIIAAVAPHAGYVYSGRIAALTFKQLQNVDFDTIVIIGHDADRGAVAYTCPVDYFRTPLGDVAVDRDMIKKMEEYNRNIRPNTAIHSGDHTIEIQLPFLQVMGKKCMIVPIMFGDPTPENCRILADAINFAAGNRKVFLLASSDMSHYPSSQSAYKNDNKTLEVLRKMDVDTFFSYLKQEMSNNRTPNLRFLICASGGVGTAMLFAKAKGANYFQVQKYANSGDVPGGDKSRVVGYSSDLFIKKRN